MLEPAVGGFGVGGWNSYGQIGNNKHGSDEHGSNDVLKPYRVLIENVDEVATGYDHTCVSTDGSVSCWGHQYGVGGGNINFIGNPNCEDGLYDYSCPTQVDGISDVVKLAAGERFTCALRSNKTVKCWGLNTYGQLGNNGNPECAPGTDCGIEDGLTCEPEQCMDWQVLPVDVLDLSDVESITAGRDHVCALKAEEIFCWGSNSHGQIANSDIGDVIKAHVRVNGISNVVEISAGGYHTCARKNDNSIWCWGKNFDGQLGNSNFIDSNVPKRVTSIESAVGISAGDLHTCAIDSNYSTVCWGYNDYGQLGYDKTEPHLQWEAPFLFDTSYTMLASPKTEKIIRTDEITWNGVNYLISNVGNQLRFYDVNRDTPRGYSTTDFNTEGIIDPPCFSVANGDSDWNLAGFSACDDCEYAVATFYGKGFGFIKVYDLAGRPYFDRNHVRNCSGGVSGALTFKHNGIQYLVSRTLVRDVEAGCSKGLYIFGGIQEKDIQLVQCLDNVFEADPTGGYFLPDIRSGRNFIYLGTDIGTIRVLELHDTDPISLSLLPTEQPIYGLIKQLHGVEVDMDARILVSTYWEKTQLWNIDDLSSPKLITGNLVGAQAVALRVPYLFLLEGSMTKQYDISDPRNPIQVNHTFWTHPQPWNETLFMSYDILFSRDSRYFYYSRDYVMQRFRIFE